MRNLGSPDQQNSQVTAPHHRLRPNRVLSQVKVFGFEDIVEAHRAMEQGLAVGKMVVAVN
jgi:Zinc-binding dehydrogenase